jgi:DNA-binding XRE family transcriptional regulator
MRSVTPASLFSPEQNDATSGWCATYRGQMGDLLRLPDRTPRETPERAPAEPLWRELVGRELRAERQERGERLSDVAQRAGVSTQYLSEVERGLKDPSSEILSAVAGALDLTVRQLSVRVARSSARYGALCLAA